MSLESALTLAAAGLPVFPCDSHKRPLVQHWREDATTDTQRIREWWEARPDAMIGLPTGRASGLFAVDLDVDKVTGEALGEASLAKLGLSHLLTGPYVNTPSGGRHLYFRWPGEGLGNTAGKLGPSIDTRGEGGYVVAAGSLGGFLDYDARGDWLNPPELPVELRELLMRPPHDAPDKPATNGQPSPAWGQAALRAELTRLGFASEGERNHSLNHAAFRVGQIVGGGHLDKAAATAELEAVALSIGLPLQEIRRTIESGLQAGMASPRGPEPRPGGTLTGE